MRVGDTLASFVRADELWRAELPEAELRALGPSLRTTVTVDARIEIAIRGVR